MGIDSYEPEQMLISTDNEVGLARNGAFENAIVIFIVWNRAQFKARAHNECTLG